MAIENMKLIKIGSTYYRWSGDQLVKATLGGKEMRSGGVNPKDFTGYDAGKYNVPFPESGSAKKDFTDSGFANQVKNYDPDSHDMDLTSGIYSRLHVNATKALGNLKNELESAGQQFPDSGYEFKSLTKARPRESSSGVQYSDPSELAEKTRNKVRSKQYQTLDQMPDIVRGRISVNSSRDVRKVARHLIDKFGFSLPNSDGQGITDYDHPAGRKSTGYPRFHLVVREPKTGIKHEIQIGTHDTNHLLDNTEVKTPNGKELTLHDGMLDIFSSPGFSSASTYKQGGKKVTNPNADRNRAIHDLHGFTALNERYKRVLANSGAPDSPYFKGMSQKERHQYYQDFADELSEVIDSIHKHPEHGKIMRDADSKHKAHLS